MGIFWLDGFDYYNSTTMPFSQRYSGSGSYTYGIAGRFGGQCMRFNSTGDKPTFALPATGDNFCLHLAARFPGQFSDNIWALVLDTRNHVAFALSTSNLGIVKVWNGFGDSLLVASAGSAFPVDTNFHSVEWLMHRDPSAGTCQVFVDGVSVINATGLNTGTWQLVGFQLGSVILSNPMSYTDFDDLYCSDQNVRIGERRVELLPPIADVTTQWTPNSGVAHFSRVNETVPDGDTSYVASGVVAAKDSYSINSLSSIPTNIDAVQTVMIARKTDATTRTVRSNLISGPTTGVGATRGVPSSYGLMYDLFTTDPNGGAIWTATSVNGVKVGIELVA